MELPPRLSMAERALDYEPPRSSSNIYGTPPQKPFFDFLQLPTEIRLKIYGEVFIQYDDNRSTRKIHMDDSIRNGVRISLVTPGGFDLAMVNKQTYNESLPVLYNIHVFRLSSWEEVFELEIGQGTLSATKSLLAQLIRPSAPRSLSMMTHLYLFLDERREGAHEESRDAIIRQVCTSCTSLETFCLQMENIPQDWLFVTEDFKHEQRAEAKLKEQTLNSLRILTNRVGEFELTCLYGHNEQQYEDLWERVFPGQYHLRTKEDYLIRWSSNLKGARRCFTFW